MRWDVRRTVASAARRIKQGSGLVVAAFLLLVIVRDARAQAPDEDWRTLATDHFRVTFPARMELLGRRAASVAEIAYDELSAQRFDPFEGQQKRMADVFDAVERFKFLGRPVVLHRAVDELDGFVEAAGGRDFPDFAKASGPKTLHKPVAVNRFAARLGMKRHPLNLTG